MASEFDDVASRMEPLEASLRELQGLADAFGQAMTTAFRQAVVDGRELEHVLKSLALSLAGRALSAALAPIGQGIGGIIGGVFGGGAAGAGVGPGAASTLAGPAQRLGASSRATGLHVTFNVSTPDAQSFRRAEAEVSAMLARAVARGQRGL